MREILHEDPLFIIIIIIIIIIIRHVLGLDRPVSASSICLFKSFQVVFVRVAYVLKTGMPTNISFTGDF